ncbi:MAG: shikimate dehydrogenase [Pseudomonadota bacterium]|nr:shikimate dehydrogenase [Pseudomonadota bacterium]
MKTPHAHVIGDPIAQSKSPVIHGFWLEQLGISGGYEKHRVDTGNVGAFVAEQMKDPEWRGCNVTMPHKREAMEVADLVEARAKAIGAVNTLVRKGDKLAAFNTDAPGFLEALRPQLSQQHLFRMARILGTGGAARAIVKAMAEEGFTIVLAGRNPQKARAMLDELAPKGEHHAIPLDHFAQPTDFAFDDREGCLDLVVNASPLGMRGQPPLLFDWSHAPPGSIAYDIVTDPIETDFLRGARDAGFATIDGYSMLIGQAAVAFEKFFGHPAPREHDAELRERLMA